MSAAGIPEGRNPAVCYWRTGRRNRWAIYALEDVLGQEATDRDSFLGALRTQEASRAAVDAQNARMEEVDLELAWWRRTASSPSLRPTADFLSWAGIDILKSQFAEECVEVIGFQVLTQQTLIRYVAEVIARRRAAIDAALGTPE